MDGDGDTDTGTVTITAGNMTPVVRLPDDWEIDECQAVALSALDFLFDRGTDNHTYLWYVTDDDDTTIFDASGEACGFTVFNEGSYTVALMVEDDKEMMGLDSVIIPVNNVAPQDVIIEEGQSKGTLSALPAVTPIRASTIPTLTTGR